MLAHTNARLHPATTNLTTLLLLLQEKVTFESNPYASVAGADAIAILTEWEEFKSYDFKEIYAKMRKPVSGCERIISTRLENWRGQGKMVEGG